MTDAGLESLTGLANLKRLFLTGTKVTEVGVKKLSAALPGCKIDWDGAKSFVTLRKGAEAARHATLEEALEASQPQDVIEVHGNGPFPIGGPKSVVFQQKEFTLKAAAGFRPLFVPSPSAADKALSLFHFNNSISRFEDIDPRAEALRPSPPLGRNGSSDGRDNQVNVEVSRQGFQELPQPHGQAIAPI